MNSLYYGDNLEVLRKYIKDETVDLCYIDPPFNSKRNYNQIYNNIGTEDRAQAQAFVDTWTWDDHASEGFSQILSNDGARFTAQTIELMKGLHAVLGKGSLLAYLVSMTLCVVEIRRVLKSTGSFYLHCDPTASHYLKLVLDTAFVVQGGDYRNEIVWKRTGSHNDSKRFALVHDVLLYYVKGPTYTWNEQHLTHSENYLRTHYNKKDSLGRVYRLDNIIRSASMGERPNLAYEYNGYTPRWGWRMVREKLELLAAGDHIEWSKSGIPYLKRYLDEQKGLAMPSVWDDIPPINSQAAERLGYPTQKPEALLERLIQASTNPGDTVLDAYCGCGTTIAVAQRLGRAWVGMDITYQSISLILRRLEAQFGKPALESVTLNGIPRDMASAVALANKKDDRVRKEFEKWAVLTYSGNRAIINEKKGADAGVDGIAYFQTGHEDNAKIIFQVKSGGVGRGDIAKLHSDMLREGAVMAVFLTLQPPTGPMKAEAKGIGTYHHDLMQRNYDKVQIVTVQEIIEQGKRLDIPLSLEVVKKAQAVAAQDTQTALFTEPGE